jgi:cyclopropane fatty-acyl-phospholipid synthase-like methyltransferase
MSGDSERNVDLLELYGTKSYLDAYSAHTDLRVQRDPQEAVGGMWEEIGRLQLDFLMRNGLQPHHRLLDIGCGALRAGRHFIRYLNDRNYTGLDIPPKAIQYSKELVRDEGLSHKRPKFVLSKNKHLKFRQFTGETYDYLLAQSVFTHLKPKHIKECFQHIGTIMHQSSVFFFTFNEASDFQQTGVEDFRYPSSFFRQFADKYGFDLIDRSEEFEHPRNQRMAVLTKRSIA